MAKAGCGGAPAWWLAGEGRRSKSVHFKDVDEQEGGHPSLGHAFCG